MRHPLLIALGTLGALWLVAWFVTAVRALPDVDCTCIQRNQ